MSVGEREFDRTTIKQPGAPPIAAFKFTCSKCGTVDTFPLGSKGNGIAMALVQQKMRHRGWEIGNRASGDVCPHCIAARRKKHTKDQPKENNVVSFIKVEEPPTMTREDRRLIFAKIDEVYLSEDVGYSESWSDSRVAEDLGVPLAWVRGIREENFGEERNNASVLKQLQEARDTLNEAKKLRADSAGELQSVMAKVDAMSVKIKEASDLLASLQKTVNSLNHDIARQEAKITETIKSLSR